MVSLAYLVKRRSVEPENRVRFPEIPKIDNLMAQLDRASVYDTEGWGFESFWDYKKMNSEIKIDKRNELIIDYSRL